MILHLDECGASFTKPTFWLDKEEYSKIVSEINTVYYTKFKGKRICAHTSFDENGSVYLYWFENRGFNDYNIFLRVLDDH